MVEDGESEDESIKLKVCNGFGRFAVILRSFWNYGDLDLTNA